MQDKKTLLMEKWAEALESGEYKQTIGTFKRAGKTKKFFGIPYGYEFEYCAVGVYYEIARRYDMWYSGKDLPIGLVLYDNDHSKLSFKEIAAKLRAGEYE